MARSFGLISVVIVAGIIAYLNMRPFEQVGPNGTTPPSIPSTVGVRNDLLSIANAERRFWTSKARYASLNDLNNDGDIQVPTRPDYTYTADVSDLHFSITATYKGSDPRAPKRLTVDETMSIASN